MPLSRSTVLSIALALFVVVSALRFASEDPTAQIATFLLLPIALLGMEFGFRGGWLSALAATMVVVVWFVARDVDIGLVGVWGGVRLLRFSAPSSASWAAGCHKRYPTAPGSLIRWSTWRD
jgi:hypothetical protein